MASPVVVREVRVRCTTAFASNHSNAAASPWTTATKMLPSSYDDSGLKQDGFADDTLKTRLFDQGEPTPGLSRGSYKMGFRGLGCFANVDPTPEQILMNAVLGEIVSPTERNVAMAVTTSSTTIINISTANTYVVPGQACLIGKKGDARGCGEVKPIVACNATALVLGIACNAAPTTGDQVVFSTTMFPNEDSPQSYIEHLAIGKATDDQKQTIGGMAKLGFTGLGMSERPGIELEVTPADWRTCPATERASLAHATAPIKGAVTFGKGIGLLHLGDYNTSTRVAYRYADVSHDPGLTYAEIPGPGGVNGVEGWAKQKGNPKTEFTLLYDEDMPGLAADFQAGTKKHMMLQFGHEIGKCLAIEQAKSYIEGSPSAKAAGPLAGVAVIVKGCDDYNATSNIRSAAVRYHAF